MLDISKDISELIFKKSPERSQFYGRSSKVMIKVPKNVKNIAIYSFKIQKLGFKGGLQTGWKRAYQLAMKDSIPIEDAKFMYNWFARHVYASYPSYKKWVDNGKPLTSKWYNKRGIISWLIWGGDPALKWINSKTELLSKYYNKPYKMIKL